MGVFFSKAGSKSVYVAGDSTWQPFITEQISQFRPDVIVLNTGNALVTEYAESIIMGCPTSCAPTARHPGRRSWPYTWTPSTTAC